MVLAPGSGARHRDRLLLTLAPLKPVGVAQWERDIAIFGERIGPSDLIFFITDGFDEPCIAAAERLAATGRDVSMIQVLTADERDFPFATGYRFHDPESGAALVGDGPALRQDFLTRFAKARTELESRLTGRGIRLVSHFVDESPDQPIRALSRETTRP